MQPHRIATIPGIAGLLLLVGCASDPESIEDLEDAELAESEPDDEADEEPAQVLANVGEVVFASEVELGEDGDVLRSSSRGTLDEPTLQAIGRPWTAMGGEYLYSELSVDTTNAEGHRIRQYEVRRRRNDAPLPPLVIPEGPPDIDEETARYLAEERDEYVILLKLAGLPEFRPPLLPASRVQTPQTYLAAVDRRGQARAERQREFEAVADPVRRLVEADGGELVTTFPGPGWVAVKVPARAVDTLLNRVDINRVTLANGAAETPGWRLGVGRIPERLNAETFWDEGFDGNIGNPTRHNLGNITIGDVETGLYEDEACAFMDSPNCQNSRIKQRYRCDNPTPGGTYCEITSNFADNDTNAVHGTAVMTTAAGDYRQGQGDNKQLGDPAWTSGAHSSTWENQASGIAKEAGIALAGQVGGSCTDCGYANALERLANLGVDIALTEFVLGQQCDPIPTRLYQETLEDAYDDGVFVVSPAGNVSGPSTSSCNILRPANMIKAFAVNAYNAAPNNCTSNPSTRCLVDQQYSARGGLGVEADGKFRSDALRGIDLVAPNRTYYHTWPTGAYGSVGNTFVGTSNAGPHVAGLAALVKDWYIEAGNTWINNPGRLFTVMLAMGDRHYSTDYDNTSHWTIQRKRGGSVYYGVGRAKLRLLRSGGQSSSYGNSMISLSWSSANTPYAYYPFTSLPSNTELVKCVAMQHEDMSAKDDVSYVQLRVRIKPNCGVGDTTFYREDHSYDVKKMIAIESSETTLAGRCVQVEVDPDAVTSSGVSVNVMCYHSNLSDDE